MFCLKTVAENEGDFQKSVQINNQREHLNDSLRESQVLHRILGIDYQESHKLTESRLSDQTAKRRILLIVLAILIFAGSLIIYWMRRHHQELIHTLVSQIEDLAKERQSLQLSNDQIQSSSLQLNKRLAELLTAYHGLCGRIIDMSTSMPEKAFFKKFKEEVSSFTQREEFLKELQKYIDEHNDNALEELFKAHPDLNTKERGLIILTAWQMRSANIAICLDISSENTIRGMRKRLSEKLSLPIPLAYVLAPDFTAGMLDPDSMDPLDPNVPVTDLYAWYIDAYMAGEPPAGGDLVFQCDIPADQQETTQADFWFVTTRIRLNAANEIEYMDYYYVPWN